MKNAIYILILMLGLSSCKYSKVVLTEDQVPENTFYLPEDMHPYTGHCIIYYAGTENIKEQLTFRKGVLNGTMNTYYPSGELKIKGQYKDGKLYGKWESWYEGGQKKYEVNYVNDTLNGSYVQWYATGVMKEQGLYAENIRRGSWVEYDEAGMIIRKLTIE
jgi:antitoxin component YwqK of YwqJK toxin-antitoxin module